MTKTEQKSELTLDLTPPHPADSRAEQLRKLTRLLDAGVLTPAEYELQCQEVFDEI
jgi:hypothetical protein